MISRHTRSPEVAGSTPAEPRKYQRGKWQRREMPKTTGVRSEGTTGVLVLLIKIENIIREMLHIDIDIFHRKNSIFKKCWISVAIGRKLVKILSDIPPHVYYVW